MKWLRLGISRSPGCSRLMQQLIRVFIPGRAKKRDGFRLDGAEPLPSGPDPSDARMCCLHPRCPARSPALSIGIPTRV
jgi:hypothetical protein